MQLRPGASEDEIAKLASALDLRPDHFYLAGVLARADGMEGFIDDDQYIRLWRAKDIAEENIGYEVDKYAPGLLLVGSNGGGEAFAFVKADLEPHLLMVPFVPLERAEAKPASDVLEKMLKLIAPTA